MVTWGIEIHHKNCGGIIQGRTCTSCSDHQSFWEWLLSTKYEVSPASSKETRYHILPRKRYQKLLLVGLGLLVVLLPWLVF